LLKSWDCIAMDGKSNAQRQEEVRTASEKKKGKSPMKIVMQGQKKE